MHWPLAPLLAMPSVDSNNMVSLEEFRVTLAQSSIFLSDDDW